VTDPHPATQAELDRWDAEQNERHAGSVRRVLVARHHQLAPHFYDVFLEWLAEELPEVRGVLELRSVPLRLRRRHPYAACVFWVQDPPEMWSVAGAGACSRLLAQCDRRGIPVVNRVDRLGNASKSTAARLIATAGLRTPLMGRVDDPEAFRRTRLGIPLPLFVRDDWTHGALMVRADTDADVAGVELGRFSVPIAVELIDLPSPDGLYRKYRYVVAGDKGVPQSLHVGREWIVRGGQHDTVYSDAIREEELAYLAQPEPNHARFVAAAKALGLDFVAFDYSRDGEGKPVVWEANPYPLLHLPEGRRDYRQAATKRVFAAMAALYLERGGIEVPASLEELAT
jgi:hypothetical protein